MFDQVVELYECAVVEGFRAWYWTVSTTDDLLSLLPPYKCARDFVLDSVLGPVEDFESARTTTPK